MNTIETLNISEELLDAFSHIAFLTPSGFERIIQSGLIEDLIEAINGLDESILTLLIVLPERNAEKFETEVCSCDITSEENQKTRLSIDHIQEVLACEYPEAKSLAFKSFLRLIQYSHHVAWWNANEGILSESERRDIRVNFLDLGPLPVTENAYESA